MGKKQTNYIDIDLNLVQKQQIRIDGDDNRIIELDTGDLTIINRLKEVYPRLNSLGMKGFEIDDTGDETSEATMDNIGPKAEPENEKPAPSATRYDEEGQGLFEF